VCALFSLMSSSVATAVATATLCPLLSPVVATSRIHDGWLAKRYLLSQLVVFCERFLAFSFATNYAMLASAARKERKGKEGEEKMKRKETENETTEFGDFVLASRVSLGF